MAIPEESVGHVVVHTIFQFLIVAAVALRLGIRIRKGQKLSSDDWAILASLVLCLGLYANHMYGVTSGSIGIPWLLLAPERYQALKKIQFAAILISHFVYGLIKISVVLFYKRIFSINGEFRIAPNITLVLISIYMVTSFFIVFFSPQPLSSVWTTPPELECTQYKIPLADMITAFAVIDVALDLIVLSLPLRPISKLKLSRSKRFGIAAMLFLGAFCLVCSVVRLYYTRTLEAFKFSPPEQQRGIVDNNDLWAHIEAYASVFTACLPTLHLFPGVIQKMRSRFSSASRSGGSQESKLKQYKSSDSSTTDQEAGIP